MPARNRGTPMGVAVQAEATATFAFAKLGQVIHPGAAHVGTLAVVDIGIAPEAIAEVQPRMRLLDADEIAPLVPVRAADAHRAMDAGGLRGRAVIVF